MELILLLFILVTFYLSAHRKPPINGVYAQKGPFYPVKYIFFRLTMALRQISAARKKKRNETSGDFQSGGRGVKSYSDPKDMDKPQPFSSDPSAFDAVFFSGAAEGQDGNVSYFVAAAERRPGKRINGVFYILLPEIGLYRGTWLPQTKMTADTEEEWKGQGLHIRPIEPLRTWKVTFDGQVKKVGDENAALEVSFDGHWSSDEGIFDYDTDLSPSATARAFALEEWNEQYFKDLQKAHQTHYEQLGFMRIRVKIPEKGVDKSLAMWSFRDHSFGTKRDWKLMHRYTFHHIFLPNGWKAVVGVVCQPSTCTALECGFVSLPNGRIAPLESCSLRLYEFGEGGNPPVNYAMLVEAGGQEYTIEVDIETEAFHYYGDDSECRMVERFARYKVNGQKGAGICEWQNRNFIFTQ